MATMLKLGSRGPDVTRLQKALNQAGRSARPKLVEDGYFGEQTRSRVVEFQLSRGLPADGVAGPATQAALGLSGGPVAPGGVEPGVIGGVTLRPVADRIVTAAKVAHIGVEEWGALRWTTDHRA